MKKLLASAALSFFFLVGVANAEQFYRKEAGQWTVEGFQEENAVCAASTFWDNGSYVSFFVSENGANVMVHNTEWNIGDPPGAFKGYQATLRFFGKYNPDEGIVDYKLTDKQTVVLLNVNTNFLDSWTKYDTMVILMPGDIGQITVGLSGTSTVLGYMAECLEMVEKVSAPKQNL